MGGIMYAICNDCKSCSNNKGNKICRFDTKAFPLDVIKIERCPWPSKRVKKENDINKGLKNLAIYIDGCSEIEYPEETKLKMLKEAKKCLCEIIKKVL